MGDACSVWWASGSLAPSRTIGSCIIFYFEGITPKYVDHCLARTPCLPSFGGAANAPLHEQMETLTIRFKRWLQANAVPTLGGYVRMIIIVLIIKSPDDYNLFNQLICPHQKRTWYGCSFQHLKVHRLMDSKASSNRIQGISLPFPDKIKTGMPNSMIGIRLKTQHQSSGPGWCYQVWRDWTKFGGISETIFPYLLHSAPLNINIMFKGEFKKIPHYVLGFCSTRHGVQRITAAHFDVCPGELRLKARESRMMVSYLAICLRSVWNDPTKRTFELDMCTALAVKLSNWSLELERCPIELSFEQASHLHALGLESLVKTLYAS